MPRGMFSGIQPCGPSATRSRGVARSSQSQARTADFAAFLAAAATGGEPLVGGEDGLLALRTAISITDQVSNSRERFSRTP